MLTANDIHHLVGLLSRATHPEDVEIEMGSFVWDEASESKRDVDVTVTVRNADGSVGVFKGIEVKAHGRKLGSEAVEQLAQKLKDMPTITHRSIVSASGYTRPAIRKAKRHGVSLYELKRWEPAADFDYFGHELVPAVRTECGWAEISCARINPSQPDQDIYRDELNTDPVVSFAAHPNGPHLHLKEWLLNVSRIAAQEFSSKCEHEPKNGHETRRVSITVNFTDDAWVFLSGRKVYIREIRFDGLIERRVSHMPSELKALVKLGESRPVAGCCVSDFGDFLLALIMTDGKVLDLAIVPLSERNKQKIFKRRLSKMGTTAIPHATSSNAEVTLEVQIPKPQGITS